MTDRPCPIDGAALPPGATICAGCLARLRNRLRDVPGLLVELDVTATGIGSTWRDPGPRNGSGSKGLVIDERAQHAQMALVITLFGWAKVLDEQDPVPQRTPARSVRDRLLSSPAGQAALLAAAVQGSEDWAPDCAAEVEEASRQAWRAVDIPVVRRLVCTCTCGTEVTAAPDASTATCRTCGERWDVAASRALAVEAAQDVSAPAVVIERVLGPAVVTAAMIRGWRHRGSLEVAYVNDAGRPCYRVADVALLAREGAPIRTPQPPIEESA